jgi:hypothetical protein
MARMLLLTASKATRDAAGTATRSEFVMQRNLRRL